MTEASTQRYARLAKRGDVVVVKVPGNDDREAVVRDVDVILHLADGSDYVVNANSEVDVVTDNLPPDLQAQIEAMQSAPE